MLISGYNHADFITSKSKTTIVQVGQGGDGPFAKLSTDKLGTVDQILNDKISGINAQNTDFHKWVVGLFNNVTENVTFIAKQPTKECEVYKIDIVAEYRPSEFLPPVEASVLVTLGTAKVVTIDSANIANLDATLNEKSTLDQIQTDSVVCWY